MNLHGSAVLPAARDFPVLDGLAEVVENAPEFGKLVEKQHPVVRKRDLPRLRVWPAARKPDAAYRVVRGAERTPEALVFARLRKPRRRVYSEDFEKFFERRRGHD